jgi:hypothetical protein
VVTAARELRRPLSFSSLLPGRTRREPTSQDITLPGAVGRLLVRCPPGFSRFCQRSGQAIGDPRRNGSASRESNQQDDTAAATMNSGTSSALDLACANMFLPLHSAFTTFTGQPLRSVFWKLHELEALKPENVPPSRLKS